MKNVQLPPPVDLHLLPDQVVHPVLVQVVKVVVVLNRDQGVDLVPRGAETNLRTGLSIYDFSTNL